MKKIKITPILQEQTEWCWAACSCMIVNYYNDSNLKQIEIVKNNFRETTSDSNPILNYNQGCNWKDIITVYKKYKLKCCQKKTIKFKTIAKEINNNRPIELGLHIPFFGDHVVIVTGFKINDGNYIYLIDPNSGGKWVLYNSLFQDKWIWKYTWLNFKKNRLTI